MRRRLCWQTLALGSTLAVGIQASAQDYTDRVLESGTQVETEPIASSTPGSGWPRSITVELQDWRQTGLADVNNQSLLLNGYLDTPDYGALSANLNLNRYRNRVTLVADPGFTLISPAGTSYRNANTGRIDQRALPFNAGWFANNSLGDINTASTALARGLGYVYLPTLPIEGLSTVIERPGQTSFNASIGQLGYFDGMDSQGFVLTRGEAASLGWQQQLGGAVGPLGMNRSDAAMQWLSTRRFDTNGQNKSLQDTDSFWTAMSWQGLAPWASTLGSGVGSLSERPGGLRIQANLAHSQGRPSDALSLAPSDDANGVWLDAAWRTDWLQQRASVFHFDPALRWGSNPIANDLRGASWRADIATRQWQLAGNLELSDSVSGQSGQSLYGGLFGRYRLDSRDAMAATVAGRSGEHEAQSLQLSWEHQSRWGQTQWHADAAHDNSTRLLRLGADHSWNLGDSHTLSTSLSLDHSEQNDSLLRSLSYGLLASLPLGPAKLDLSVRGTESLAGSPDNRFLNASGRLSWPLWGGWSVVADFSAMRGREALNPMVLPALSSATQNAALELPESRSLMLALRYEARAGTASAPLGGAPGSGAGRIEGYVYFDQNSNGSREANEAGTPGVSVLLDQRYLTRTDAQGFYRFNAVAAGPHQIELIPDNLPLPWVLGTAGPSTVEVRVREDQRLDFGVVRQGGN